MRLFSRFSLLIASWECHAIDGNWGQGAYRCHDCWKCLVAEASIAVPARNKIVRAITTSLTIISTLGLQSSVGTSSWQSLRRSHSLKSMKDSMARTIGGATRSVHANVSAGSILLAPRRALCLCLGARARAWLHIVFSVLGSALCLVGCPRIELLRAPTRCRQVAWPTRYTCT